jgi:Helix-turn-helix domain
MPAAAALPKTSQADQSFGRHLRRERERRKIPLESIAENTKISVSLFEDMERDDLSRWPSGIFRRSFIRAYARAVGLDADETARQFLECFPDLHDPDHVPLALASSPPSAAPTAPEVPPAPSQPAAARTSVAERLMAVLWDVGIVITLGLLFDAAFGWLWAPLAVATIVYYAGGVLIFGNTAGVCLCVPAWRKSIPVVTLRRSAPSSSGGSSKSTDSGPAHQSDARAAHPYQAPGT